MTEHEIKEEIDFLLEQRRLYYTTGNPEISDNEYDTRHDKLVKILGPNHWFSKLVGHVADDSPWEKAKHLIPLGSLTKVNVADEFTEWCEKLYKQFGVRDLVLQEKLDGISIDLVYEDGKLAAAITRGDGEIGEDIFRNVVKMNGVPLTIDRKDKVCVRGEILFPHSIFHKLKKIDDAGLKNPRNAAAGIAKRLDGTRSECLNVISYDVLNMEDCGFKSEYEACEWIDANGFDLVTSIFCSLEEAIDIYNAYIDTRREALDWDIDGLVVKSVTYFDPGSDWSHPKNKVAWKFPHQRTSTIMIDIEASARGGRITPVALLEPVECGGVTIRRASLSNWPNVEAMGIGKGAKVEISRRNDVIPYVESVLVKGEPPVIPTQCPVCNGDLEYERNISGQKLVYLICTNDHCPTKLNRKIMKWLNAHETKGIGGAFVELMVDGNHVTSLIDFLNIPFNPDLQRTMRMMDGMGSSKIKTINTQIENTCRTTVKKFMLGLDIKGMGKGSIDKLIDCYKGDSLTVESFIEHVNKVRCIDSFGPDTLLSYRLQLDVLKPTIDRLLNIIVIEDETNDGPSGSQLKGMVFCFTGNLSTIQRKDAQKFVEAYGGKCGGANKKLTHLVCNNKTSNTGKAKQVRKLWEEGVDIKWIDEKEFLEMIGLENKIEEIVMPENKPQKKKKVKPVQQKLDIASDIGDL